MKWFVSGTLVTLAVVGSVFVARHFTPERPHYTVRYSHSQVSMYSDAELAGEYYLGDGMGANNQLELLKTRKFIYRQRDCMGESAQIRGTWQQEGDVVPLTPDNFYELAYSRLNLRYIPVSWGKRFSLVDENEMPGFCDSVFKKEYLVSGRYISASDYVRHSEELFPQVQGKPKVPELYKDYLEHGEIKAIVTGIGKQGYVFLQENGSHRLKPGMRLCLIDSYDAPDITVIEVDGSEIRARQLPAIDHKKEPIRKGNVFTTGSNWDRPEGTWELAFK